MNKETAPYVRAILETATEPWLKSLRQIARRLHEENLVARLDDVTLSMSAKKDGLRQVLGDAPLAVINLIYTLAGSGDLHLLDNVILDLEQQLELVGRGLVGSVRSAVPLTAEEKARLEESLSARFGEDLVLSYEVDPTIIGGVVVRAGDLVIDGSVAAKLAALKEQLS